MSDTKPYCSSKPQLQTATTGSSTAPLPWSDHYAYTHTELDENHTNCKSMSAVRIFLMQRPCQLFIASPVTPPCTKKYIRGQCPVVLSISEFENCTAESRIRTSVPGRHGSKALLLALHDKDESFFIKSEQDMTPFEKDAQARDAMLFWRRTPSSE